MIISWIGADLSFWDLTTGAQGVKLLGGLGGMDDPEFSAFWAERIGDGDRYLGSRWTRRTFTWRVLVGTGQTGMAWRTLDRAWWRGVTKDAVGLLSCTLEDASSRFIYVRLARSSSSEIDFDPAATGYRQYLITMVSDEPFWRGADVTTTWTFTPGGENFYGGSGGGGFGPPYYLSASGGFGESTVTNAGDVPAWPRWRVTGPSSSALLTVDGHTIAVPSSLSTGVSRYIDTGVPDVYGDFLESRWNEMTGAVDFAPVPVGATVPITATVSGPGTGSAVTMTITPRYLRAW